jgi:ankyrin repeat protein
MLKSIEYITKIINDIKSKDTNELKDYKYEDYNKLEISCFMTSNDEDEKSVLMIASSGDNLKVVKFFIENGANIYKKNIIGYSALTYAIVTSQLEIVKYLIESGADIYIKNLFDEDLFELAKKEDNNIYKYLIKRKKNYKKLNREYSYIKEIIYDIKYKSEKFEKQKKIITQILYKIPNEIIDIIVSFSDFNELNNYYYNEYNIEDIIKIKDNESHTILMYASIMDYIKVVKFLLENRANIHDKEYMGNTALILAIESYRNEISKLLVDNGADIHYRDEGGYNAIENANACGNEDLVNYFNNKLVNP